MAAEPDIVARMERQARTSPWLAIHRASDRLRQTLGETLPEMGRDEAKLARVTTRSLKAVQLYSQAEPLSMKNQRLLRNF